MLSTSRSYGEHEHFTRRQTDADTLEAGETEHIRQARVAPSDSSEPSFA
jgi:hypothetical protein